MASARWENSSRIYEAKEAFAPLEHKRVAKTKIAAFEKKRRKKIPIARQTEKLTLQSKQKGKTVAAIILKGVAAEMPKKR